MQTKTECARANTQANERTSERHRPPAVHIRAAPPLIMLVMFVLPHPARAMLSCMSSCVLKSVLRPSTCRFTCSQFRLQPLAHQQSEPNILWCYRPHLSSFYNLIRIRYVMSGSLSDYSWNLLDEHFALSIGSYYT